MTTWVRFEGATWKHHTKDWHGCISTSKCLNPSVLRNYCWACPQQTQALSFTATCCKQTAEQIKATAANWGYSKSIHFAPGSITVVVAEAATRARFLKVLLARRNAFYLDATRKLTVRKPERLLPRLKEILLIRKGAAVILVTHKMNDVNGGYADQVTSMRGGRNCKPCLKPCHGWRSWSKLTRWVMRPRPHSSWPKAAPAWRGSALQVKDLQSKRPEFNGLRAVKPESGGRDYGTQGLAAKRVKVKPGTRSESAEGRSRLA